MALKNPLVLTALNEGLNLRLNLALHRYITYPGDYDDRAVGMKRVALANSGFFMVEDKKSLQCFFCLMEITNLKNWTNLDIGQLNLRHSTECLRIQKVECPLMKKTTGAAWRSACRSPLFAAILRPINSLFLQQPPPAQSGAVEAECDNIPLTESSRRYNLESYRLLSMLKHAFKWKNVSVHDLARSGFYYKGDNDDNCICQFCKLEVRGWEDGDTADGEHRRWNPTCLRELSANNAPLGSDQELLIISKDKIVLQKMGIETVGNATCADLGVILVDEKVKYPAYSSIQSRLKSYRNWPRQMSQKPKQLAESGFFYTGRGDRVICFYCGGGLKEWSAVDDPREEHFKWFENCSYLKIKTPVKFPNSSENKSMVCKSCKTALASCVSLPCAHIDRCVECVTKAVNCDTCKATLLGFVRVYI